MELKPKVNDRVSVKPRKNSKKGQSAIVIAVIEREELIPGGRRCTTTYDIKFLATNKIKRGVTNSQI